MEDLFVTEKVRIADLIPSEINPRKIKESKKRELWLKLQKYGFIGIPVRDFDGTLLSGHQRCSMYLAYGFGEKEIDVRTAIRKLTEAEIREVMIIENTHSGEFDLEILHDEFADYVDLGEFGLDIDEITKELTEAVQEEKPEFPIVPKFNEQYSAVVIVIENSIDENFVRSVLGLEVQKDYKTENVGESYVLTAKDFIEKWNQRAA
jgi:hypothetical protein